MGRKAEAQRLCRLIAGTGNGIRKRKTNTLCEYRPSRSELVETALLEASSGGLSASEVNWEQERANWTTDTIDDLYTIIGHTQQERDLMQKMAKEDLRLLTRG